MASAVGIPAQREDGVSFDADHLLSLRHVVARTRALPRETTGRPGGFASRFVGHGLDIREVRPLSEGDDFRHIDAMTTARTGRLHVRTFFDDRDRTSVLIADFRRPMLWGTHRRLRSVAAAQALALLGWQDVLDGCRVGVMTMTDAVCDYNPPRVGDRGMAAVTGRLASAHAKAIEDRAADAVRPLHDVLERAFRVVPRGATVYLATGLDVRGEHFDIAVRELGRRARLMIVRLRDAFEREPPRGSYAYFSTDSAIRRVRINADRPHDGDGGDENFASWPGVTVRTVDTDTDVWAICRTLEGWHDGPGRSRS